MSLDVAPLARSVDRLREGLSRHRGDPADEQLRDGLIQRFEFTYEVAHKTLRRYLEQASANPADIDAMSFADVIRSGNEQGLLRGDWQAWRRYREMRSRTSHAYDARVAAEVVADIPEFLAEVEQLRDELGKRLG